MNQPITDAIKARENHISFHTPAHGGVLANLDVTELSYTDNLLAPNGVIEESEREASLLYGVDATTYITTGATTAVAVAVCSQRGKDFLVVGAAHKSVFNWVGIFARKIHYLFGAEELENALEATGAGVVIVTSPSYFGMTLNLSEISAACKAAGAVLIIDASHGSHFAFSGLLPDSATEYGDLVIHSAHKTLSVYTGGAMLHYKNRFSKDVAYAMNLIHSTSPSYLVMTSIEGALAHMEKYGEEVYKSIKKDVDAFAAAIKNSAFSLVKTDDFSRVVIRSEYSGSAVAEYLEGMGIFPECSAEDTVVFIVSENTSKNLWRVSEALRNAPVMPLYAKSSVPPRCGLTELRIPTGGVELVPPEDALNRVVATPFGIYPPGVPSALYGEVVTEAHICEIKNNINNYFGLVNGMICVVK